MGGELNGDLPRRMGSMERSTDPAERSTDPLEFPGSSAFGWMDVPPNVKVPLGPRKIGKSRKISPMLPLGFQPPLKQWVLI